MDINSLWIVVLSIATPVAGVVGFAIQLRQVKKAHLENEKLQLEIVALKEKASEAEQRIVKPTNEEVLRVNHGRTMFSRRSDLESRASDTDGVPEQTFTREQKVPFKEKFYAFIALACVALVAVYFFYDIYRVGIWVISKL